MTNHTLREFQFRTLSTAFPGRVEWFGDRVLVDSFDMTDAIDHHFGLYGADANDLVLYVVAALAIMSEPEERDDDDQDLGN